MKVTTELLEKLYSTVLWSSVIGFIASIFMPWIAIEGLDEKMYFSSIMIQTYSLESGFSNMQEIIGLLNLLHISLIGAIVLSMIGLIGLGLRKGKKNKVSRYMMIGSIPLACFSVSAMLVNILILRWINNSDVYTHAYNIIPMIISIVMVIGSALLVVLVGRRSFSEVLKDRREKKNEQMIVGPVAYDVDEATPYHPADQMSVRDEDETVGYDCTITEQVEIEKDHEDIASFSCPNCDSMLMGSELICPVCRANISKRCPNCNKLASFFAERCPQCDFSGGDDLQ